MTVDINKLVAHLNNTPDCYYFDLVYDALLDFDLLPDRGTPERAELDRVASLPVKDRRR